MRSNKVQVWLRTKPSQNYTSNYIEIQNDKKTAFIHIPRDEKLGIVNNQISDWSFAFDGIFHNQSQESLFHSIGDSLVDSALNGFNCTILCYGQTGAGKTYTMTGATENFHNRGIVPRALSLLFKKIKDDSNNSVNVKLSYLEIYNEQMFDLLPSIMDQDSAPSSLGVSEEYDGSIMVKGLSCHMANTEEDALNLLFEGEANRAIAAHSLNKRSSRSHCILTVYLETRSHVQSQAQFSVSKIQFVDLAGSERLRKTQSGGKIQQEASYINKSLSFLEQTVIALSDKRREHIPYRQSKLTHFLKDSIGGRCKTMLIANIWSDMDQFEETISTMRFAQRMMKVASEPIENVKYDPTILIKNLQKEITALRHELSMYDALNNRSHVIYEDLSEQQKFEIREQVQKYADGELTKLDVVNFRQVEGVYEAFRSLMKQQKAEYEEKLKQLSPEQGVGAGQQPPITAATPPTSKQTRKERQTAASVAQQSVVETPVPPSKVGDIDKSAGFGVGQADKGSLEENSSYLQSRKKDRKRQIGSRGVAGDSTTKEESASGDKDEKMLEEKMNEIPSRSDAFEEYKKENGADLFKILTENKDILSNTKSEYSNLATDINNLKVQIDTCKVNLESMKRERECQGPSFTSDGEVIITEEEYKEIEKLNGVKKEYREKYEELKGVKSSIYQCQKMVDLTRQKLLSEFDKWYTDAYLDGDQNSKQALEEADLQKKMNYEDPIEKFDAVKHSRYTDVPEEEAYNRAKESLGHRRIFGAALNQPQPVRRKPGTPVYAQNTVTSIPTYM